MQIGSLPKQIHIDLPRLLLVMVFFLASALGLMAQVTTSTTASTATVTSDKDDYAPRSNAVFTGSGFNPGEAVVLKVKNLNRPCNTVSSDSSYLPWSVTADASGGFVTNWIVCDCIGDSLRLKATGQTSGLIAYAFFTDGNIRIKTNSASVSITVEGVSYLSSTNCGGAGGTPVIKSDVGAANPGTVIVAAGINQSALIKVPSSQSGYIFTGWTTTANYNTPDPNKINEVCVQGKNGLIDLTANYCQLSISTEPLNQSISYGANSTFSVVASGITTLTYQWQEFTSSWSTISNGGIYSGATTATLTLTKPEVELSGRKYRCIVTNPCGNVTSNGIATLTVSPFAITASVTASDKEYDATDAATATGNAIGLNGAAVAVTVTNARFNNSNVGTAKPVTADVAISDNNYSLTSPTASTTAAITTKEITASITASDKVYDGTTVGTIATRTLIGIIGSDDVNLGTSGIAAFADANAGTSKSINISSLSLSGATSGNYVLSSTSASATADITKAASVTVVTIAPGTFTYTGSAHTPATVSVTGAGGLNLTPSATYANNINAGTATASYNYAGDANHEPSDDSEDFTIGKATSVTVVTIAPGTFTYTGSAHTPATISVTGAGGLNLTPTATYANNINAGTATASYNYAGDANHEPSDDSEDFTIGKAASTTVVTINGGPFTYTGSAHTPATVSVTGAGGLNLTPAATYANNINAGTATASYSYAGDANHEPSDDSEDFTIGKATSVTVVTIAPGTFTYTGSAHTPATVSVTGAGGLNLTPAATYANNINAGTATASYIYPGDANHEPSDDSEDFTIGKAASTTVVTINGGPFTYTGSAHTPATVSVTGAGGLNLTPAATYANNINAGTATASYNYAGDANHEPSDDSEDFTIGKAVSVTVVTIAPGTFTYTGSAHTPATVSVTGAGGLNLTPAATYANNINAGTATASYSYPGDANHEPSDDSEDFTIDKANLTITAPSMSKYCGQVNPTGYCSVTGTANNELISTYYSIVGNAIIPSSNDAKLSNYAVNLVNGVFTVNGVSVDISDASTPRSLTQLIRINLPVKNGTSLVSGVPVDLYLDDDINTKRTASSINGVATFDLGTLPVKVYKVKIVIGALGNTCDEQLTYLPVYDPNGGFVTGGGWINSPAGALVANSNVTGKANFGFVAKYKKGTNIVDGNTEFQFQTGNIDFRSTSHNSMSLVIAGSKATYKGKGTINGLGNYDFMLVATDGAIAGSGGIDKFRIKIWDNTSVIYDNQLNAPETDAPTTTLGGGAIVIHEPVKGGNGSGKRLATASLADTAAAQFESYPNPFNETATIRFALETEQQFVLAIYDVRGSDIKYIASGKAEAGKVYEFDFDGTGLKEGMYFVRLLSQNSVQTLKVIKNKN